ARGREPAARGEARARRVARARLGDGPRRGDARQPRRLLRGAARGAPLARHAGDADRRRVARGLLRGRERVGRAPAARRGDGLVRALALLLGALAFASATFGFARDPGPLRKDAGQLFEVETAYQTVRVIETDDDGLV